MANSEDYLDGLLNSVQNVRSDMTAAEKQAEANRIEKQRQRTKIQPGDDFMEASGLNTYEPQPSTHENLRQALSEDDFLRMFEEELDDDTSDETQDEFLRAFEEEIDAEEREFERQFTEDGDFNDASSLAADPDASSPEDSLEDVHREDIKESENAILEEETSQEDSLSFFDNIEQVVSEAKERITHSDFSGELPSESEDDFSDVTNLVDSFDEPDLSETMSLSDPVLSSSDALPSLDGYGADELDAEFLENDLDSVVEDAMAEGEAPTGDASGENATAGDDTVEESSLLDENDESLDLMDLLSGDDDLNDIGSLLQADDAHEELDEAKQEFEDKAEPLTHGTDATGEADAEPSEDSEKAGGLGAILGKIKALISNLTKKGDSEEELLDITSTEGDDLGQENLDILKELDDAEGEEKPKKEKKKKEKKPKEKKEKPPKPKKEKKPKPPKEPDNSPKIPMKVILVFLILAASIIVVVTLGQKFLGYRMTLRDAQSSYEKGDYLEAYEELMGEELTSDSDVELFAKARLLAELQKRSEEYTIFMGQETYELALDSLIIGVARYDENLDEATELGIEETYSSLGQNLIQMLSDQFGVSEEDAIRMYRMDREDYSIEIDAIIESLNFS